MELKDKVIIDDIDVSKCPHFVKEDSFLVLGTLKNYCLYHHDLCEMYNCDFKKKAKKYKIKTMQAKLDRIEEIAKEAPSLDTELSLRILEVINDQI